MPNLRKALYYRRSPPALSVGSSSPSHSYDIGNKAFLSYQCHWPLHYVTDLANSNAFRARQRSALPQTPEVKVTLEVPRGAFSKPSKVEPAFNMPGEGMERTATGNIPVTIKRVQ